MSDGASKPEYRMQKLLTDVLDTPHQQVGSSPVKQRVGNTGVGRNVHSAEHSDREKPISAQRSSSLE